MAISLKPLLEKIKSLEDEITQLKAQGLPRRRSVDGHLAVPAHYPDISIFEQRAEETDRRLEAIVARCAELERLSEQYHRQHSHGETKHDHKGGKQEKDQKAEVKGESKEGKEAGKKAKGGKGKDVKESPFVALQNKLSNPLEVLLPVVNRSVEHEKSVCTYCLQISKVFFVCSNEGCPHRTCRNCQSTCGVCSAVHCKWCSTCFKCTSPDAVILSKVFENVTTWLDLNAENLAENIGWPGTKWIKLVIERVKQWRESSSLSFGDAEAGDLFIGSLMSIDWETPGEVRAWNYIMRVVRSVFLRTKTLTSSQLRAAEPAKKVGS